MMLEAYHHSGDCRFRQLPRALKTGEKTWIKLWTGGTLVQSVFLCVFQNGVEQKQEMHLTDGYWKGWITAPETPCVLWYCFLLETAEGQQYYGAQPGQTAGAGALCLCQPPCFQLTVYDRAFHTPDWAKKGVLYQIFPDRYRCGDPKKLPQVIAYRKRMGRKTLLHTDWKEEVLYTPLNGAKYYEPIDFYGGDFAGITASLPELAEQGVSVLYLNPISEAASNHRYDTADYCKADPFLGTAEDFAALTQEAEKYGIHVILDGVYSHTGADSIYFNRTGRYPRPGAWQGEKSPYYHWYTFYDKEQKKYKCWWNFESLPEVDEESKDWQKFVITGKDSVLAQWLARGASGFRLDVADELPDDVITLIRKRLKTENQDTFLLGEVWEDATTKQSYGKNREYALGRGLDSVMNYPFRNACIAFLLGTINAVEFRQLLLSQQVNYPPEMYYSLMNLLSSHDIPRIRTVLSLGGDCTELSREQQAAVTVSPEQDEQGAVLQRLAAAISFMLPGMPSIYYGDEYGMQGLRDPFNRRPFLKRDCEMAEFYRSLAKLRNCTPVLSTGYAQFHAAKEGLLAIHRFLLESKDAFGQHCTGHDMVFICNLGDADMTCDFTLLFGGEGLTEAEYQTAGKKQYAKAVDFVTGESIQLSGNRLTLSVPVRDFRLLTLADSD